MIGSKDRFTGKMFAGLWVPAMIASAGWAFSDMADAIVVGQKLGPTGLAAISLVLPVYMINCMFAHGFGLGGSVRFSKLLGEGKPEEAVSGFNRLLRASVIVSLVIAIAGNIFIEPLMALLGTTTSDGALFLATKDYLQILICATPLFFLSNILNYYLRNDNHQKLASVGSAVGNGCDIALNIVFVLMLDMGTGGAALATLIGQVIAVGIYLPGIFKKAHTIKIMRVRSNFKETFLCFKVGFSTSVQYLFQLAFLLICNNVLIRMTGETGVAVFDVIQNASYLILYLYEGTARAMQPLVSTYHGERYEQGKKNTLRLAIVFGSAIGSCLILFVELFPGSICMLFGISGTAAQALCQTALRIYAIGTFFGGISILLGNYFQAFEKEKQAFLIVLLRGALVLLPCTVLFSMLGIKLFWWLFPATEIISFIVFIVVLKFGKTVGQDFESARVYSRSIHNKNDDIGVMTEEVERFCVQWNADAKQTYYVTMTVEEICLAIIKGGFENAKDGYIQLTLIAAEDGAFELHIRDNAVSFNPFSLETKKAGDEGEYDMDAMGMRVIKSKARSFFYRRYQGFNSLVVKV
ncbi:MATE family efflux transporter [Oscillospiraceae bacterium PP1C4]